MPLAIQVREQLIASFRAELAEHVQTMNDGLLALEQGAVVAEERQSTLENVFRAAHSLKGAARAMGVTMVEQLSHAVEGVLEDMQHNAVELTPELFAACYQAVDAIETVQAVYEAGETTPPLQALQALSNLEQCRLSTDLGQQASSQIQSNGVPDLIVSDVVMPRLNGFGLAQRVREDPRTAGVPVILVTSLDSAEDKARGIEVGADAYITKSSFDQNNLLETIEQLI